MATFELERDPRCMLRAQAGCEGDGKGGKTGRGLRFEQWYTHTHKHHTTVTNTDVFLFIIPVAQTRDPAPTSPFGIFFVDNYI